METILLHGALGSATQMEPLAKLNGSNATCLDFPGHGIDSGNSQAYSIEEMALYVAGKIEEPTELFGYSMGGYVALYLAATRPELVLRVTTLATKFDWTPEGAAKKVKMLDPMVVKEKVPAFASLLESRHGAKWQDVMTRTADMMQELGNKPTLTESVLKKIKCPVMLMRGSEDHMVSEEETLWAKNAIPNAIYVELEGQPHPFEKTDLRLVMNSLQSSRQN